MELNMNNNRKRPNSISDKYIFAKKGKYLQNNKDDDGDESIDIAKFFKKGLDDDNCYVVDNNIYFNDDISMETINKLNKELRSLQSKLINMGTKLGIDPPPIKLHITSYGGSIHAAFMAINCIKNSKVPVHTIVDSYAASAGTLISVVGAKRYMYKHSNMLIHELRSSTTWNKMSDLEEEIQNMKQVMQQIKDIYVEHTNLSRSELNKILKHDVDWSPEQCIKVGLVDEIIE
jgi:ATP-dependent protease ClpP protease subunit